MPTTDSDQVLRLIRGMGLARPRDLQAHGVTRAQLSRLILGSDTPDEVLGAADTPVSGDALHLARALFPAQHPTLFGRDRY